MTSAPEATELWFPVCPEGFTSKPNTTSEANRSYPVSTLDQPLPTVWERGHESVDPTLKTFRLNQNHVVCLPIVTEGLRLIWARSEQQNQQISRDALSELEEHFNVFPYPTLTEMTTIALRHSLHPDQVRVWFMTQRLSYGISWDCEEICDARTKMYGSQSEKGSTGKEEMDPKQYSKPVSMDKDNVKKLQRCFQQNPKPSKQRLLSLHQETGLSMKRIRKWFNNQRCQKRCRERIFSKIKTSTPLQSETGDLTGSAAQSSSNDDADATGSVNLAYVRPVNSNGEWWNQKWAELPVQAAGQEKLGVVPRGNETSVSDDWKNETWQEAVGQMVSPVAGEGGEPVSPPSPLPQAMSFFPGSSGRETVSRLRNKSVIQLQLLRETFMILQWPTSEDYDGLQRLTGLTRRQLTQWFGDMRYHVKQGMARWIRPEERMKVLSQVVQSPCRRGCHREEKDDGPDSSDIHKMLSRFLPSLDG